MCCRSLKYGLTLNLDLTDLRGVIRTARLAGMRNQSWAVLAVLGIGVGVFGSGISAGAENGLGARPYLGWTSWSLTATKAPGYGGNGWLTAEHVKEQATAMARTLGPHGYTYVNVDAGWRGGWDEFGRPTPHAQTFPRGMRDLGDHIHGLGQKFGIYFVPGVDDDLLGQNPPILGTTQHIRDIVFEPKQRANHWGGHAIDFRRPGAHAYIQSIADQFAEWGVDFLKYDGVAPGSDIADPSVDARPSVEAWGRALIQTGRPIWLTLSWRIDLRYNDTWRRYANALRTGGDVESYDDKLTHWPQVAARFDHARDFAWAVGPGKGWNDLDALLVGNGALTGLSLDERRSAVTLWSVTCAPLYAGDDLTKLDPDGLTLLTNDELIAVNQAGIPAQPSNALRARSEPVWTSRQADASHVVALFNRSDEGRLVAFDRGDVDFAPASQIRDLWSHQDLGPIGDRFETPILAHGCRLLRLTPPATPRER